MIQFIPYGRAHTNPPVIAEPPWDSPQTRDLAMRACADCHSNETTWPWYANVAPVSWLVQHDVDEGRATLNFSEWNRQQRRARESAEKVGEGEMPPSYYTALHPNARLSQAEIDALVRGLEATFGQRRASANSQTVNSAPGITP
jgi:mono/diheme cytochrome c family protein